MYYCVGTTSLTVPLGTYFLTFFSSTLPNNVYAVAAVGSGFDILVLVIAAVGIQLSARFSWGWAIFEYGLLVGFSIAALVGIYGHSLHHTVHISSSWFTVSGAGGFSAVVSGCLLAIFLYSGWDTAAYVTEEAKGKQAGRAGVASVLILFVIYAGVILCLQGVAPNSAMQNNAGNILAYVGDLIGGGGWKQVMIVAVLGGTLASLLAAIVSAGRISFAMGRDRTFPRWFANVNPRFRTPWNATILFGLLNIVFLWGTTLIGSIGKALSDIVSTLGLIAAIFYLLTASAAIWYYRRTIMSSASDFFPGQVAYIAGTSNVILGISGQLVFDPDHRFLVTPLAEPGRWGVEMDLLATGSAITWLAALLGGDLTAAGLVELAARTDPAHAPILLPYLSPGEQGALWDPLLHGAVVGLDLSHGREHLARALVNGIILESRRCLAVLDETGGFGRAVEVAGGSAAHPSFRADLADATRRLVSLPRDDDTDHSARGAALIAALATDGGWPEGAFPAAALAAEPDEARAKLWDDLWDAHELARRRLHP